MTTGALGASARRPYDGGGSARMDHTSRSEHSGTNSNKTGRAAAAHAQEAR